MAFGPTRTDETTGIAYITAEVAISHQPSAISRQPSAIAVSHWPSAFGNGTQLKADG
jgi:hypothetical protein